MTSGRRKHADDVRGASELVVAATQGITELVEEMHRTIASGPAVLGKPLSLPARTLTGLVYGNIKRVTQVVGAGIDIALSGLGPLLGESTPGFEREALVAALNGVLGDYLRANENPLAIEMRFRSSYQALPLERSALRAAIPDARSKLLLLVHGSSMNDRHFLRNGHDHGAELAREFGYTAVYLHYNSGLHISENGRLLAEQLESLVDAWPVAIDAISILGYSMGGLVARSACVAAEAQHSRWRSRLTRLVCLGSPHHGSALERGGNLVHALLGVSAYSAPFMRLPQIRSAGVTDMRFGNVLDAHWEGQNRFGGLRDPRRDLSLPRGVACYAIAGTNAKSMTDKLTSDGLVPVDSALGRHRRPDLDLAFPESHTSLAFATNHLELLASAEVYASLRSWFAAE